MASRPLASLQRLLRLLRPHAEGEGGGLAVGGLLALATVVLHVLRPWPLKWMIDGAQGTPVASPVTLGVAFIGLALAGAFATYLQALRLTGIGNRVVYRLRERIFTHLLGQPLSYHQGREVGELMTRVVYDTARLRRGVNGLLIRVVQPMALLVASMVVLLWIDVRLALLLLAGGVLAVTMMRARGRRISAVARKQRAKEGRLAALVGSELAAIRELQVFGRDTSATRMRFAARNSRSLRQELKLQRLALGLALRVDVAIAVSIALAIWVGAGAIGASAVTAGHLVLFLSYALSLQGPFAEFARTTARLGRTFACADRLARIVERDVAAPDAGERLEREAIRGALRFEGVALRTPKRRRNDRKWALDGVDLDLPAGQRIAIIGGNGAGKSTLLSLVLRLAEPERGRILLDGRDLRDLAADSLRAHCSVALQGTVLTGVSVRENIALGRPSATLDEVKRAAEAAGIAAFIEKLPQGYDTVIRRGGELLSGGERQRLALARAFLRDGALWLLDEPMAGLDPASAEALTTKLLEVTRGRTTLWVTHDHAVVDRLDWVVELREGKAVSSHPVNDRR